MAALGQVRETFWEDCTPGRIEFATQFRALVNAMRSPKQGARAQQLGIAPSTLSNYWTGRRIPWQSDLRVLFAAARANSAGDAPVSLAALEELRAYAWLNRLDRDVHAASVIGGCLLRHPVRTTRHPAPFRQRDRRRTGGTLETPGCWRPARTRRARRSRVTRHRTRRTGRSRRPRRRAGRSPRAARWLKPWGSCGRRGYRGTSGTLSVRPGRPAGPSARPSSAPPSPRSTPPATRTWPRRCSSPTGSVARTPRCGSPWR